MVDENNRALLSLNQKSQPLIGKKLQTTQNQKRKRVINLGGQQANIHAHSSGGNLLNSTNSRISAQSPRGLRPTGQLSNLNIVPETKGSNYDYNILGSPHMRPPLNRQSGIFDRHHSNSPGGDSTASYQAQQHKLRQASNRKTAELR